MNKTTTLDKFPTRPETVLKDRLVYKAGKRIFDFVLASLGIFVLSPVMVILALGIWLDSGGPIFYRGLRVGENERLFYIWKFRTMVVNADRIGGSCTADDDPRITKTGKLLRKTKLDELPQLINVVRGEMSFVGPRPELQSFTSTYDANQREVLMVKPGITDFATLWDCDEGTLLKGEAEPERAYTEQILPMKLKLQLKYVSQRSLWTDLKILAQTAILVLKRGWNIVLSRE